MTISEYAAECDEDMMRTYELETESDDNAIYNTSIVLSEERMYNANVNVYVGSQCMLGKCLRFITITLRPNLFKYPTLVQFDMSCFNIQEIIKKYSSNYVGCVEITEIGNIHYHFIVNYLTVFHITQFFVYLKKKRMFGRCHLTPNPIVEKMQLLRSINYIYKSIEQTSKILLRSNYKPQIVFGNI